MGKMGKKYKCTEAISVQKWTIYLYGIPQYVPRVESGSRARSAAQFFSLVVGVKALGRVFLGMVRELLHTVDLNLLLTEVRGGERKVFLQWHRRLVHHVHAWVTSQVGTKRLWQSRMASKFRQEGWRKCDTRLKVFYNSRPPLDSSIHLSWPNV